MHVTGDFEKSDFFGVEGSKTWRPGLLVRNAARGIRGTLTTAVGAKHQDPHPTRAPGLWTDTEREGEQGGAGGLILVFEECS